MSRRSSTGNLLGTASEKPTRCARRRRYVDLPDHARRDFIKWTIGLGAALGLRPWKVFEVQESIVGPALADSAACASVNRLVSLVGGNGGLSWFTQLWPFAAQATTMGAAYLPNTNPNETKAVTQATTRPQSTTLAANEHPMTLSPFAPSLAGKKITGVVCGTNMTHTNNPTSAITVGNGTSLFAAAAAMQTASPTLVPVITVGNLPYGAATGAPAAAAVPNPQGMVDLFNSASSLAGGTLSNASDAALFEAYYKANLSLRAASARPTMTAGMITGKVAANLLGKNLASQLSPAAADLQRYGITSSTPTKLASIANTLITTAKAFQLNLTSQVMLPAMLDDPHGAFSDPTGSAQTAQALGQILDAFMSDVMAMDDPMCAGHKVGDNLVITVHGDTYKDPFNPSGWPDGTAGNSSILYVLGNGYLNPGWFGEATPGNIDTWDPATGMNTPGGMSSANLAGAADAAVLYAVAKGDSRRVNDFARTTYTGLVVAGNGITGN
jgi:hypothetical protein